jgi:hypothetical protein
MDSIELEQGDALRQELRTALHLVCEVTTVSWRETKSSAPIMTIFCDWPGSPRRNRARGGEKSGRPWGDKGGRSRYQFRTAWLGLDRRGTATGKARSELRGMMMANSAPDLLTRMYYPLMKRR